MRVFVLEQIAYWLQVTFLSFPSGAFSLPVECSELD